MMSCECFCSYCYPYLLLLLILLLKYQNMWDLIYSIWLTHSYLHYKYSFFFQEIYVISMTLKLFLFKIFKALNICQILANFLILALARSFYGSVVWTLNIQVLQNGGGTARLIWSRALYIGASSCFKSRAWYWWTTFVYGVVKF